MEPKFSSMRSTNDEPGEQRQCLFQSIIQVVRFPSGNIS